MLIKREMPVEDPSSGANRWSIDFLFVDQFATPAFVECKRFKDTRARREVIAQMLEYAANAQFYWDRRKLRDFAVKSAEEKHSSLDNWMTELKPDEPLSDLEAFFAKIEENLKSGNLRLIFFLEEAPQELKSLVEFLNKEMSNAEVLLVEAQHYEREGLKVVVPTLFGYTEAARRTKRLSAQSVSTRRKWDENQFLAAAKSGLENEKHYQAVVALLEFSKEKADRISWGTGATGSFNPIFEAICPRSLFGVRANGELTIPLGWLIRSEAAERARDELKKQMETEMDLSFPAGISYPAFSADKWSVQVQRFKEIVRRITGEKRQAVGAAG
jgi:hypothetical protein